METLARRKVLQGGAALAMAGVALGAGVKPTQADETALKDLWQRFIDAEARFGDAAKAEDEADFTAHLEESELPPVWRYCGPPSGTVSTVIGAHEKQDGPIRELSAFRFTP